MKAAIVNIRMVFGLPSPLEAHYMMEHSAVAALAGGCIDSLAVVVAPVVVAAVALVVLVAVLVADLDFLAASHCQPARLI